MKKLNYLSFLLILSLLIGCSQPRVKLNNLEDRLNNYIQYGQLIQIEGEPFSGIAFDEHENGDLHIELSIKKGKPDGPYKSFHLYGQLAGKVTFKNGELDGPFEKYAADGRLLRKGIYQNGEFISD